MGRLFILISAIFSLSAVAKTRVDRFTGSIDSAEIPATVRVPLYSSPDGLPLPSVKVMIGDTPYLFLLSTGTDIVFVSDSLVKAEELKGKVGNKRLFNLQGEKGAYQLGGKQEFVEIDQMSIGGMVLRDVVAATKDINAGAVQYATYRSRLPGHKPAGLIGLNALPPEVSWAIQPSTGTVSFATGDDIAGINALKGGMSLPYRTDESKEFKYGVYKSLIHASHLIVDAKIGTSDAAVVLEAGMYAAEFDKRIEVGDSLAKKEGDLDFRRLALQVGTEKLGTEWMFANSAYVVASPDYGGVADASFLSNYDISVNRDAKTVTLAAVAEQHRKDPLPFMIDAVITRIGQDGAETADASEGAEDSDGAEDAEKAEEAPTGSASLWSTLGDLYRVAGNLEDELDARSKAAEIADPSCVETMRLGQVQLRSGDVASAINSFETAVSQYDAWYRFPADVRAVMEKHKDKAWDDLSSKDQKVIKASLNEDEDPQAMMEATHPAAGSCHKAAGWLAASTLAAGDAASVAALYSAHLDLDPRLARIAGNALISQGQFEAAQAPLRQAVKMTRTPNINTRLGLALIYAQSGDWGTASKHFDRVSSGMISSATADAWLAALTNTVGEAGAREALTAHVKSHPDQAAAYYGLARVASADENPRASAKIRAQGESFFKTTLADRSRDGRLWAIYARYLVATGEQDQAKDALNEAEQWAPVLSDTWLARADIAEAEGDADAAKSHRIKAAQANPWNPALSQLLTQ